MKRKSEYQKQYIKGYVRKDRPITTEVGLKKIICRVADAHGFDLSHNADKIVNAKLMLCKEDYKRCPCDHTPGSKRYCGSPFCVRETKENGRCHCGLFLKGGNK